KVFRPLLEDIVVFDYTISSLARR
ncbi:Dabb family protein, partial [Vibrio cholerae]